MRFQLKNVIEAQAWKKPDDKSCEHELAVSNFALSMVETILRNLKVDGYITGIKCKYEDGKRMSTLKNAKEITPA